MWGAAELGINGSMGSASVLVDETMWAQICSNNGNNMGIFFVFFVEVGFT
jgi:hypothetical protein